MDRVLERGDRGFLDGRLGSGSGQFQRQGSDRGLAQDSAQAPEALRGRTDDKPLSRLNSPFVKARAQVTESGRAIDSVELPLTGPAGGVPGRIDVDFATGSAAEVRYVPSDGGAAVVVARKAAQEPDETGNVPLVTVGMGDLSDLGMELDGHFEMYVHDAGHRDGGYVVATTAGEVNGRDARSTARIETGETDVIEIGFDAFGDGSISGTGPDGSFNAVGDGLFTDAVIRIVPPRAVEKAIVLDDPGRFTALAETSNAIEIRYRARGSAETTALFSKAAETPDANDRVPVRALSPEFDPDLFAGGINGTFELWIVEEGHPDGGYMVATTAGELNGVDVSSTRSIIETPDGAITIAFDEFGDGRISGVNAHWFMRFEDTVENWRLGVGTTTKKDRTAQLGTKSRQHL